MMVDQGLASVKRLRADHVHLDIDTTVELVFSCNCDRRAPPKAKRSGARARTLGSRWYPDWTQGTKLVILVMCGKRRSLTPKPTCPSSSTLPSIVVSAFSFSGMASPPL